MIDPVDYLFWCVLVLEVLIISAVFGWLAWLEGMRHVRVFRPIFDAWDWLLDRTRDVIDAIARRLP